MIFQPGRRNSHQRNKYTSKHSKRRTQPDVSGGLATEPHLLIDSYMLFVKDNDARLDSQNDLDMVDKHREKIPTAALFGYPKNPPRQNWHSYGICFISRQLNERGFPSVSNYNN
jgi:hypothetical protein